MITSLIAQLKKIEEHCDKVFLMGLFYAFFTLVISIINIQWGILLGILGIFLMLVIFLGLSGEMIKIQITSYNKVQKLEKEDEDEKWRTKMTDNLKKGETPNE